MMNIKVIKNEKEYEIALTRIEELFDTPVGDPNEDELELLYMVVEKYEDEHYPIDLPDPIEAIKFRMEQTGLTRKDLVPYIGSQSKVSEVLNRKRPLSLNMIRALHEGLGISFEILLKEANNHLQEKRYHFNDYPFAEMFKEGYFGTAYKTLREAKEYAEECLESFFSNFNIMPLNTHYRKSQNGLGDDNALKAWQAQVLNIVSTEKIPSYDSESLPLVIKQLTQISYFSEGIRLVKEALNDIGIHFIILKHLPKTKLDGACFFSQKGNPVIAMTLRYDRLDYFWFTLFHEFGHISNEDIKDSERNIILDDTETGHSHDDEEIAANNFALNSFIPTNIWKARQQFLHSRADIISFSKEFGISTAVIAGRIRKEEADYTKFADLIGQGDVRKILL